MLRAPSSSVALAGTKVLHRPIVGRCSDRAEPPLRSQALQQKPSPQPTALAVQFSAGKAPALMSASAAAQAAASGAAGAAAAAAAGPEQRPRLLLLGGRRSGKSSIQRVVFHKMSPHETLFLESTDSLDVKFIANNSTCRSLAGAAGASTPCYLLRLGPMRCASGLGCALAFGSRRGGRDLLAPLRRLPVWVSCGPC